MNIIIKTTDSIVPIMNTDFKALKVNIDDWNKMTYFQKKDTLQLFCKEVLSKDYLGIESFKVFNGEAFTSIKNLSIDT